MRGSSRTKLRALQHDLRSPLRELVMADNGTAALERKGMESDAKGPGQATGSSRPIADIGKLFPQVYMFAPIGAERLYQGTMRMRKLISSRSPFEADIGYSRAVVDGSWIFVSGTTGFDYRTMTISDDVATQTEQTLRNIGQALEEAGSSFSDVVRVRYILRSAGDFEACWPVLRRYLGSVRPAATMIEAGLSDPRMKIEIEATARRQSDG
jgi:enamine deaminase RidA (YjgF/YER057c/UK114 family)